MPSTVLSGAAEIDGTTNPVATNTDVVEVPESYDGVVNIIVVNRNAAQATVWLWAGTTAVDANVLEPGTVLNPGEVLTWGKVAMGTGEKVIFKSDVVDVNCAVRGLKSGYV
jgi:hypothetical protein